MPAGVNREEGISCGTCVEECPEDAIALDEEQIATIDEGKCLECEKCAAACPSEAIQIS